MTMDPTERVVADYFAHRGYKDVQYEPDGNIPPDFVVDRKIAVEIRRLNQHFFSAEKPKGLEQTAIPLCSRISNLLTSLGSPIPDENWSLFLRFSRPIESWKLFAPKLRMALHAFVSDSDRKNGTLLQARGIKIEINQLSGSYETTFVMGGYNDKESGGWLLGELQENINFCIQQKTLKIEHVRHKYSSWWLALVDYIGYGLNEFDKELFRDQVSIEHGWDRVILISPLDHTKWFEI